MEVPSGCEQGAARRTSAAKRNNVQGTRCRCSTLWGSTSSQADSSRCHSRSRRSRSRSRRNRFGSMRSSSSRSRRIRCRSRCCCYSTSLPASSRWSHNRSAWRCSRQSRNTRFPPRSRWSHSRSRGNCSNSSHSRCRFGCNMCFCRSIFRQNYSNFHHSRSTASDRREGRSGPPRSPAARLCCRGAARCPVVPRCRAACRRPCWSIRRQVCRRQA